MLIVCSWKLLCSGWPCPEVFLNSMVLSVGRLSLSGTNGARACVPCRSHSWSSIARMELVRVSTLSARKRWPLRALWPVLYQPSLRPLLRALLLDLSCLHRILAKSFLQWLYLAFEPLTFGLGFKEFSLFHLLWLVSNNNLLGVREKSEGWLMGDQWGSPQSPPLPHPPLTAGVQGSLPRRPETLCLTPRSQCVLTSLVRAEPAQGWCSPVLLLDPHTLWRPYGCTLTCQVKQKMLFVLQ